MSQIAYQTSSTGVYVGPVECQPSPEEPGVYLVPAGAVLVQPPAAIPPGEQTLLPYGAQPVWDASAQQWSLQPIAAPPQP